MCKAPNIMTLGYLAFWGTKTTMWNHVQDMFMQQCEFTGPKNIWVFIQGMNLPSSDTHSMLCTVLLIYQGGLQQLVFTKSEEIQIFQDAPSVKVRDDTLKLKSVFPDFLFYKRHVAHLSQRWCYTPTLAHFYLTKITCTASNASMSCQSLFNRWPLKANKTSSQNQQLGNAMCTLWLLTLIHGTLFVDVQYLSSVTILTDSWTDLCTCTGF